MRRITCLVGLAVFGAYGDATLPYTRTEDFAPVEVVRRSRLSAEPQLYAEFLCKYGMFQNYLHYWIDRPLFCNRAMRPSEFAHETAPSFAVHARELGKSGFDGFNLFMGTRVSKADNIWKFDKWLVDCGEASLHIVPTLSYGEAVDKFGPNANAFATAIGMAQKNPRFPRLGGKVLVPTYNYRLFGVEQHRTFMKTLREALGNDAFILCGDISQTKLRTLRANYYRNGRLSDEERLELEKMLTDVLDVCGGLQLSVDDRIRDLDGPYCSRYDTTFFENCTSPLVKQLLARPEYAGKALGFYVHQGYINHHSGHDHAEDGTATFRREMAAILKLDPDFIICFEWNEVNENTMFQPTVWNGHAVNRLVRWYSNLMKNRPVSPMPGDDTSLPNITLSYRATAKVGELLQFELLNVPDGVRRGTVPVQLRLEAPDGAVVQTFPVEQMDETRFGAISYAMSTIALTGGTALCPVLEIEGRVYRNLHPIRLAPTVSWNYKMLRHNIRDLMAAERASVKVERIGTGRYAFAADLAFGEKLASVELMVGENEQASAGSEKEYDRASNNLVRLAFTTPPGDSLRGAMFTMRVQGAKGCSWHPLWIANVNPGSPVPLKDGSGVKVRALIWAEEVAYGIQIPKTASADAAIEVTFEKKPGFAPVRIPLKTVLEKGVFAATPCADLPLRIDARRMDDLPDLPPWIGRTDCIWRGETVTDVHAPVFHFRAISESGRVWRSHPIMPDAYDGERTEIPVWDEYARGPAKARVPVALVPEIDYEFTPATGAALANGWEIAYAGQLGGGFMSDQAFCGRKPKVAEGGRAPTWVKDGSSWCLSFDGTNDYVNLPKEAFPQAAFTLEMEVKPMLEGVRSMTLFRHFSRIRGSLSLFIRDGRLFATWGDKNLSREPSFATGLEIKDGEWNAVSVSYDFTALTFRVNGVEKKMPWRGRACFFKPAIFGGHDKLELSGGKVKPVYFRGLLRRLSIRHR